MRDAVEQMVSRVSPTADTNQAVNIFFLLSDMAMDIIGTTIFGVDFKAQSSDGHSEVVKYAKNIFRPYGGMSPWVAKLSFMVPFARPVWNTLGRWLAKTVFEDTENSFIYLWGTTFTLLKNGIRAEDKAAAELPSPVDAPCFREAESFFKDQIPPSGTFIELLRCAPSMLLLRLPGPP